MGNGQFSEKHVVQNQSKNSQDVSLQSQLQLLWSAAAGFLPPFFLFLVVSTSQVCNKLRMQKKL